KIDIIRGFPVLFGFDIEESGKRKISRTFSAVRATQVYTAPLFILPMFFVGGFRGSSGLSETDVIIHERIERMGLTTELISVNDEEAFSIYLDNKDLEITNKFKFILNDYMNKDYSFVVSWISDINKFKEEQDKSSVKFVGNTLGVYVVFPTEDIYFPLKPTSIYGNKKIPVIIYVMDHVKPELSGKIKENSEVNYFLTNSFSGTEEIRDFFYSFEKEEFEINGVSKFLIDELKYTKIKIDVPSKYLTEDLWIKNVVPKKVSLMNFITDNNWLVGFIFLIISSCLASMFAGLIAFRDDEPSAKGFILFGVWNVLTLIGFIIATIFMKTLEDGWDKRKILFVFLFSVFFLIISYIFQNVLMLFF
ncbi:hypothetical protein CL618_03155, partial [archaeon]|nr:hypothetical protein [archaeon]